MNPVMLLICGVLNLAAMGMLIAMPGSMITSLVQGAAFLSIAILLVSYFMNRRASGPGEAEEEGSDG